MIYAEHFNATPSCPTGSRSPFFRDNSILGSFLHLQIYPSRPSLSGGSALLHVDVPRPPLKRDFLPRQVCSQHLSTWHLRLYLIPTRKVNPFPSGANDQDRQDVNTEACPEAILYEHALLTCTLQEERSMKEHVYPVVAGSGCPKACLSKAV